MMARKYTATWQLGDPSSSDRSGESIANFLSEVRNLGSVGKIVPYCLQTTEIPNRANRALLRA